VAAGKAPARDPEGDTMKIEVRKLERIETTALANGCCGCTDC
jgi:hypothetical protein